jgi:hypothetical protein
LSDVNAERTYAGALVLYRLLCGYPADRLQIVSYPTPGWQGPIDRLPDVPYHPLPYRIPRLIFNRFNPFWPVVMARYIRRRTGEAMAVAEAFRPDAVLSVAHDYLWFVADRVARRSRLPLHLILHDDWPHMQSRAPAPWIRPAVMWACQRLVGRVFRRAAALYAVSPGMAVQYQETYGVSCRVLYPSRGADSPQPLVRVRSGPAEPLVLAYAGMIHTEGTARALRGTAGVLARLGGRLDLYVPYTAEQLAGMGLALPALHRVGFFPAHELARRIGASAHALLLPASFLPDDRRDISTLFPSKLADYTAIGLPLVVWGPPYSSVVQWAVRNPQAAERVLDPDPAALAEPLMRLSTDTDHARRLAAGAVAAGMRDFDAGAVRARFLSALAPGLNSSF